MQVDAAAVQRIARLARIKVTEEEAKALETGAFRHPRLGQAAR